MVECWQVRTAFSEEDLVRTLGLGPFGYLDGRASWRFDKLKDRLAKVRERGYAMDNQEILDDVQCVAAPVMAAAGRASERLGYRAEYTDERV